MKIPSSAMLGKPENGFKTFLKTLTSGRISIGALSVGTALGAYEKALEYSLERRAFDQPIHKFQSIGFKLADMATNIEASKLLVYHAAWLKDQGKDFNKEAAMAKLFSSETAMNVTNQAIQVHGGYGYVKDYDEAYKLFMDCSDYSYAQTIIGFLYKLGHKLFLEIKQP